MAQPSKLDDTFKFGCKLGWAPALWGGRGGIELAQQFHTGIFSEYHFNDIGCGLPLLGWGLRFMSFGLQIGLCYSNTDVQCGHRRDIDPETKFLSYSCYQEILFVPFNIKSLAIPISLRSYMGKSRKFCFFFTVRPTIVFSIYKLDWLGELANRPGYEFLDKYLRSGRDTDGMDGSSYDFNDPKNKKNRDDFYHEWQKRRADDKRTRVPIKNVFPNRWTWGMDLGMDYEMDIGLILSWTIVSLSSVSKSSTTFSMIFGIGYNLNKLLT